MAEALSSHEDSEMENDVKSVDESQVESNLIKDPGESSLNLTKICDDFVCKDSLQSDHEESGIGVENGKFDNTLISLNLNMSSNDCSMSFGSMKKDDSGLCIDSEKSPSSGKDGSVISDLDISECACDTQTDSGAISRTNSVSESSNQNPDSKHICKLDKSSQNKNEIEKIGIDSIEIKHSCDAVSICDKKNTSDVMKLSTDNDCDKDASGCMSKPEDNKQNSDVTMATLSDSDEGTSSKLFRRHYIKGKRRYRIPKITSDSDSDIEDLENKEVTADVEKKDDESELDSDDYSADHFDDNDDDDNEEEKKEKTEESKSDTESDDDDDVQSRKTPKHTWKALTDLRSREYGANNRTPPAVFREKVHGSLQMVQRFKLQYKMEYHEGCVNSLNFNRIGTLLASGSDDLNIVLWNWIRNRPTLVYDSGHRSNVFQAKFMPFSGDCHVVSCARDGQIRLGELSLTGICKGTKKLAQHKGAAHKLALELDSPHVFLSCGEDALVYEVDLREDKPNKLVQTKENDRKVPLYSINSNPVNSYEFCVGGRDHFIRVYDKRKISEENCGLLKKYCPHKLVDSNSKANVTCAVYSFNGAEILGSYNDDDIYLFNSQDSSEAEYIHKYSGHRNNATVKGVNFYGPRSEFVVSGSDCGHIYLWDKETEEVVQFLPGDEGGVINVLEPHPFAPVLATSGLDHDVKIWAPTLEEATTLPNLKKTVKQNKKEREERMSEPRGLEDMIDGHMLYYLMRQMHRARRRNEPDEDGSSSSSSEFDSDDESDDQQNRINCAQS